MSESRTPLALSYVVSAVLGIPLWFIDATGNPSRWELRLLIATLFIVAVAVAVVRLQLKIDRLLFVTAAVAGIFTPIAAAFVLIVFSGGID